MGNLPEDFTLRPPALEEAKAALDLISAAEVAEYGESDYSLEDLLDQWSDLDLHQDAWLVLAPDNQLIGYAAVLKGNHRFTFDFYAHPTLAPEGLNKYLLAKCEARAREKLGADTGVKAAASIIFAQGNLDKRQLAEELGFMPYKYHFNMRITLDTPPVPPVWPAGITLRTAVPDQDDRLLYNFIQAAFDRPGRVPPSFEDWRDFMMGVYNFESDLWFLAYHGDELIGAILCFDYPQNGWVRQLGVAQQWRRQGIGSALLQHVLGVFYRRGHTAVGLGVEADNQKARQLYERVGMKCMHQYAEYSKTLSNS